MKTIGDAIEEGLITTENITQEDFKDHFISPCSLCRFLESTSIINPYTDCDRHDVCTLFAAPFNGVSPEPLVPSSAASLISIIKECKLREMLK